MSALCSPSLSTRRFFLLRRCFLINFFLLLAKTTFIFDDFIRQEVSISLPFYFENYSRLSWLTYFQMFVWLVNKMNTTILSDNSSTFRTSTLLSRATTSRIPHHEQVLIDNFNTYVQIGIGSILFLFGLTFNTLSLVYFCASRSFRHTTFQLYFSIISILDTVRLLEFVIFILFDMGYLQVTLKLCRLIFFTIMFTGQVDIQSFSFYLEENNNLYDWSTPSSVLYLSWGLNSASNNQSTRDNENVNDDLSSTNQLVLHLFRFFQIDLTYLNISARNNLLASHWFRMIKRGNWTSIRYF